MKSEKEKRRNQRYGCVITLLFISQTSQMRAALLCFVSSAREAPQLSLLSLLRAAAADLKFRK